MDIQNYQTYLAVADTRNFRAAGEMLGIAQSTVSGRIQALEDSLGCELFERNKRKVALTSAGSMLMPYARRIVKLHEEAAAALRESPRIKNRLNVGVDPCLMTHGLKKVLSQFSKERAETALSIVKRPSRELVKGLLDGRYDLCLTTGCSSNDAIKCIPYRTENFILAGPLTSQFAGDGMATVAASELIKEDLVCTDYGDGFGAWLRQYIPDAYEYSLSIGTDADPIDFITNTGKSGFVLESAIKSHPLRNMLQAMRLEGADIPALKTYLLTTEAQVRQAPVGDLIAFLNIQNE